VQSINDKIPGRGIIYAADIHVMTGMKPDTARKFLRKIRHKLNKPTSSFITIEEFCICTGLDEEFVKQYVK
jgi:hypothetical protein